MFPFSAMRHLLEEIPRYVVGSLADEWPMYSSKTRENSLAADQNHIQVGKREAWTK